jgi:hypothetical protein
MRGAFPTLCRRQLDRALAWGLAEVTRPLFRGPTQTETFTASKRNLHGDLVTCGLDASETGQEEDLPRLCNGHRRPHAGVLAVLG